MSVDQLPGAGPPPSTTAPEVPLWRLNAMRVGYALMGIGLAVVEWPIVVGYDTSTPLFEGVVHILLTAMGLLALLGLRYPLRLIPILLFECLWKLLWLSIVALPTALAGDVDAAMGEAIFSCSLVVVILAATPWGYVWRQYVTAPGDRWRRG